MCFMALARVVTWLILARSLQPVWWHGFYLFKPKNAFIIFFSALPPALAKEFASSHAAEMLHEALFFFCCVATWHSYSLTTTSVFSVADFYFYYIIFKRNIVVPTLVKIYDDLNSRFSHGRLALKLAERLACW